MAYISPFQATRYASTINLESVVAPPYDVLTKQMIAGFQERSSNNVVYLSANAKGKANPYEHIRPLFESWKSQQVLSQDTDPCFYLLKDNFIFNQQPHQRKGVLALVCLEDGQTKILPHEKTLSYAIQDRLDLLQNTDILSSPIFLIADDVDHSFLKACDQLIPDNITLFSTTEGAVSHEFGVIRKAEQIKDIQSTLNTKDFLIADGHHRFKTAQLYAKERNQKTLVLAYITSSKNKGLVLSSIHRSVLTKQSIGDFLKGFSDEFETLTLSKEIFDQSDSPFALVDYDNATMHLWKRKTIEPSSVLFEKEILEKRFHLFLDNPSDQEQIKYFKKSKDLQQHAEQTSSLSFWLRPVPIDQVFESCKQGTILPQKTTYFYPKVPDGLVFYELNP